MDINRSKTELLSSRDTEAFEPHASSVRCNDFPYQASTLLTEPALPQLLDSLGCSETPLAEHTSPTARESVQQDEKVKEKRRSKE